jgi:hypothetical protein
MLKNANEKGEIILDEFYCKICDVYCSNKYKLKSHYTSTKHNMRIQGGEIGKKGGESGTYHCSICNFHSHRKDKLNNHYNTVKHINNLNLNKYRCDCGKIYTHKSSLCKHKKLCNNISFSNEAETNKTEPDIVNAIMEVVKQNNEFKELLVEQGKQLAEQNKQIIELSSKPTTTNNTNNTTNNNNSFNLNFFLNETCKDALNITDFISQLHVGIKDLEETGRLGYADGISKIFINGLKQLGINQRPVHCSDAKRETIYIKDKNQWEKDDEEKVKLTNAIRKVAHKNIEQIAVWTEAHPEYMDYNSKYNEKYMKLIGEAMPGATYAESDKNYRKIARNITKETIIDK